MLMKALIAGLGVLLLMTTFAAAQDDPYRDLIDEICGCCEIYEDADLATVFDSTLVDVEATGLSHVYNHKLIKVLSWDGAKRMTALRLDYDPASNFFEPRLVKVHRADGSVEEVDISHPLDHPQPQHMIYWGPRMKVVELPRLNVGDAVEVQTYMKGFLIAYLQEELFAEEDDERYIPPMRGHYYDSIYFVENDPIREKVYTIRLLRTMPAQYKVYNGEIYSSVTFDGDDHYLYRFWMYKQPALKREPRQPGASDFIPKVVLATVKDWPEKSRWFFEVNNEILMPDEAVTAKAYEIVEGLKTDDEKIDEILHWTAQNIRYSGISMGEGEGYTLHSGMMSLHDRCGVCKDIAGMSIALLRGLGYTVYPAMTMAGSRVEDIPADQFNHCVVAVKRDDGSYKMIDPTWAPYAMDVWSPAEAEQHYVIGSPEGEERMAIRTYDAEENLTQVDLKGTLDADGDLEGTITVQGTRYGDTRIRRGIAYRPAEFREAMFSDWVARIAPDAEFINYTETDIDDLYEPYILTIKFKAPGYATVSGDRMMITPAVHDFVQHHPRTFDLGYEYGNREERENPLHIWNTRQVVLNESIKLPAGYELVNEIEAENFGGEMGSCDIEVTQNGRTLLTHVDYKLKQRTIPAKYYDQVKGSYDKIKDFGKQTLLLKKGS
jgi:transglutaminase-like putative cysteine protease